MVTLDVKRVPAVIKPGSSLTVLTKSTTESHTELVQSNPHLHLKFCTVIGVVRVVCHSAKFRDSSSGILSVSQVRCSVVVLLTSSSVITYSPYITSINSSNLIY
jgi:hypothetical protein